MPLIRSHAKRVRDAGNEAAVYLVGAKASLDRAQQEFEAKRTVLPKWNNVPPTTPSFTPEEQQTIGALLSGPTFKEKWEVIEQHANRDTILEQVSGFEGEAKSTVEAAINTLKAKIADTTTPLDKHEKPLYENLLKAYEKYQKQANQGLARLEEERKILAGMIGPGVDGLRLYAAVSELKGLKSDGATVAGIDDDKERLLQHKHTGRAWYRCDIMPQYDQKTREITSIYVRFGGITESRSKEDRDAAALGVATQALLAFGNKPVVITGVEKDPVNRNRLIAALLKVGYSLDQIYVQAKGKHGEIQDILVTKLLTDSERAAIEKEVKKYEDGVILGKYKPISNAEVQEGEVEKGFNDAPPNPAPNPDVPSLTQDQITNEVLPKLIATATKPVNGSIFGGKSSGEKIQMREVKHALGEYKPQDQAQIFTGLYTQAIRLQETQQQGGQEYKNIRRTMYLIAKSGDENMHQRLIRNYHDKHGTNPNAADTALALRALHYFEGGAGFKPTPNLAAVPQQQPAQPPHQHQPPQANLPPAQPHQHQPAPVVNYAGLAAEFLAIANREEPTGLRTWLTRGNSVQHQCHRFLTEHNTPETQALIFAQLYIQREQFRRGSSGYNNYSTAMRSFADSVGGQSRQIQIRDVLMAESGNQQGVLANMCVASNPRNPLARIWPQEIISDFCREIGLHNPQAAQLPAPRR